MVGERTSYETGAFSWVDLSTTDPEAAKRFYAGLFGWELEDTPAGEGVTYTMCRIGGKAVAAISGQMEIERQQGVPPHWNSYITAHDLDERAGRVSELGGNVMAPPFDVLDVGRMAVVADPTGAVFMMWQPKSSIGAELVNVPDALTWNELGTHDVDSAKRFYADHFGWTYDDIDMNGQGTYSIILNGDQRNGGIRAQTPQEEDIPPNWLPYFAAASVDESAAKAKELGGNVLVPTMHVPNGAFTVVADPQGAVFALFHGEFDD
jgi:predicted enzyme related to lactoylglutathione lyase